MSNDQPQLTAMRPWADVPIDDYVQDVARVWSPPDAHRPMLDIWNRVVQHCSELGELVRRNRFDRVPLQLGRITIWMLTFAARGRQDLSGVDGLFALQRPL